MVKQEDIGGIQMKETVPSVKLMSEDEIIKRISDLNLKQLKKLVSQVNKKISKEKKCKNASKTNRDALLNFLKDITINNEEIRNNFINILNDAMNENIQTNQIENKIVSIEEKIINLNNTIKTQNDLVNEKTIEIKNELENLTNKIISLTKYQENMNKLSVLPKNIKLLIHRLSQIEEYTYESIEQLINNLRADGLSENEIHNTLLLLSTMQVLNFQKILPMNLDLFYSKLTQLVNQISTTKITISIPEIRNHLSKNLNLDFNDIDRYIIACYRRQWISLELGSPIGENNPQHLVVDGGRYYYLKLIRKI